MSPYCLGTNVQLGRGEVRLKDAYGHIALGVDDITALVRKLRPVVKCAEPGPMKHGSTVIAFVEDPNGRANSARYSRFFSQPESRHRNRIL